MVLKKVSVLSDMPIGKDTDMRVTLDELIRFFINPSRYYMEHRLGIKYTQTEDVLDDTEPFAFDGLLRYEAGTRLVDAYARGEDTAALYRIFKAEGLLPHGNIGRVIFNETASAAEKFYKQISAHRLSDMLEPFTADIPVGEYTLSAFFSKIYKDHLLMYRFAPIKPKDKIRFWLTHLALNAAPALIIPTKSILAGCVASKVSVMDKWYEEIVCTPSDNARMILSELLHLYFSFQYEPLPFFENTSFEYADALCKNKTHEQAVAAAAKKYYGSHSTSGEQFPGDCRDEYISYCLRGKDFSDGTFAEAASRFWDPFFYAVQKEAE